jgi:glutaminase
VSDPTGATDPTDHHTPAAVTEGIDMTRADPDADIDTVLAEVAEVARPYADKGQVAAYIPSLAEADPSQLGIAVVEMDGDEHLEGDVDVPFPIQSISKVFSLVLAMQKAVAGDGVRRELWERVGREPSGDPFNSLVQLERERGVPRNPMINAGALVVDDVLLDHCDDPPEEARALLSELAGGDIGIDETVLRSEADSSHRNRAMANLMKSFGNLNNTVDDVLRSYTHQCSFAMTTRQLARAVRFLANDGIDPASGREILPPKLARRVAAIMLTCGTYDAAGEFAFNVGLPCKSGVAGGIVGLVPDRMGVCVWSPPLDAQGNSFAGRVALHELAERLDLSLF